jgi:hypothetical protein
MSIAFNHHRRKLSSAIAVIVVRRPNVRESVRGHPGQSKPNKETAVFLEAPDERRH